MPAAPGGSRHQSVLHGSQVAHPMNSPTASGTRRFAKPMSILAVLLSVGVSGSCRHEAANSPEGPALPGAAVAAPEPVETGTDPGAAAPIVVAEPAEPGTDSDTAAAVGGAGNAAPGEEPGEEPVDAPVAEPVEAEPPHDVMVAASSSANPLAGCTLCHVDIEDEYVGSTHYNEGVACTKCHGPSEGHLADENNEIKPDELFAREDVDRLCGVCHDCPRPEPDKPPAEPKVCTDCHGPHDVALLEEKGPADE